MEEAYLKCKYSEGLFSDEYFINFKGSFEREDSLGDGFTVMKERFIVKDKTSGLMPIISETTGKLTSKIRLNGIKDASAGAFFTVPNEEIFPNNPFPYN